MTSSPVSGRLRPPSGGTPPPDRAELANGEPCFLAPLARETARRHLDEFPDERDRYGAAGLDWCAHDIQWVLGWAAQQAGGADGLLDTQLAWLCRLLAARGYPVERVSRAVATAAEVVDEAHGAAASAIVTALRRAASV